MLLWCRCILPAGAYSCGGLLFKGVVSDNHMRNESLLPESDQFPFLWVGFSWSVYEIKCFLNAKTVLNGLLSLYKASIGQLCANIIYLYMRQPLKLDLSHNNVLICLNSGAYFYYELKGLMLWVIKNSFGQLWNPHSNSPQTGAVFPTA